MTSLVKALKNTISISLFNKGLAGKIFNDVKKSGVKIVMKNNNPEAIIMSVSEYERIMDELSELKLMIVAQKRLENLDENEIISNQELMNKYGISEEDIQNSNDIEIE